MAIIRINELPSGSGNLSPDDLMVFMDNPSSGGTTKNVPLSQLSQYFGSGGPGGNPFDQDLNTFNSPTFDHITISGSQITGGGTNSGDGNKYGTIELIPDSGLYDSDQYLIVDPTAPSHIHLRAGGIQDASNAQLIIGGEKNHLRIIDSEPSVSIQTETLATFDTYNIAANLEFSTAVWETFEGNHRIVINDPTSVVYDAVSALSNNPGSILEFEDSDNIFRESTSNSSLTPGGEDPIIIYVDLAPPSSPTTIIWISFNIRENRTTFLAANGGDVTIEAADDVRIFSNDVFRLYNYSSDRPIEVITNYDNQDDNQEYRWIFTPSAEFIGPNGATIGSYGMGWPGFYNSNTNLPVSLSSKDINTGSSYSYITAYGSDETGGTVNIGVTTSGFENYLNWNFTGDGSLTLPNDTKIMVGSFDNGTSGNKGISLYCAVGYELNWQGGHLRNTFNNGVSSANILCDSTIEFPGSGIDNMEISSNGLIFSDGTTQNTAASNIINETLDTSLLAGSGISLAYDNDENTLTIAVSGVALSGHTHISSNITDFNSSVSGLLPVKNLLSGSGIKLSDTNGEYTIAISGDYIESELTTLLVGGSGISLTYDNLLDTLTIAATGLALSSHNHVAANITDFNSAVSGLIPVKDILSGTNISVSNVSGVYTIGSTITSVEQAASVVTTVFNKTGSPIPKMSAVYIDGGQGDQPTVQLAMATGDATSAGTYGITYETIGNMTTGKVVVMGALTGLNTDQFNPTAPTGNVNGTVLYLSPTTPGGLTTTKPSAPNHTVAIGTIVRTHQNAGVIEVRVQNGYELEELHNVAISGVTNGQFLQYNSSSKLWVPSSSGNFSTLQVGGINVSVSGHTHTTSNITDFNSAVSGLLPTISNFGDNRLLTNTGSATGINAETNITFDGTNLVVSGNGKFTQLQPTVVNLGTVSGNVSTNVAAGQIFDMVLNGTTTLSNPTNAVDGVTIRWRIRQDGTGGHTVSLGSDFVIPSSASSPLPWSTAANAMDVLAATYHAGRSKWDVVAFVPGY